MLRQNIPHKPAYARHCMRMNEVILLRNTKLKHLTDDQFFSVLARRSDESYKIYQEETSK